MTEQQTEQTLAEEPKSSVQELARIEPRRVIKEAEDDASEEPTTDDGKITFESNERSLLSAVRLILREYGVRKSAAAIRDAVEMPHEGFAPKQAVSALSALCFKASFGRLAVTKLNSEFLPAIAFLKSGEAVVLKEATDEDKILVVYPQERNRTSIMSLADFKADFSGYVILAKELSRREKEERNGHWFFSAFYKSKWLYVQVMIAAMVSNFLSLTTSLFTMTVYDRIIPNGAFESLIALSIGVIIALAFDFLIKGLRARFIDIASKRADIEISNKLFDRILTLTPAEQRAKTGAVAGTIKEFETVREFFNSSTLVILVDLPFVFLFIYVISLIAGPLAYVPMVAVPLVIVVGLGMQPLLARITRSTVESGMNKQAVLVETLNGLETVTATGSGKLMRKRYGEALTSQADSGNRIRTLSMLIVNFAASIQQYAQVASIILGVYLIIDGTISQGALIGAIILGGRTMSPLSQLASTLSRLNGALTAYRNLGKLLGKNTAGVVPLSPISRPKLDGEIEFKNVSYKYEGASQPVIKNLTFKIPAGRKVAIVGKMGSGKSTLSRLIAGMIQPTEGAILIDGVDVRQIDEADLRKNVGIMLQDSWLFSGTVRENIQMGFNEYDDEHILSICKIAGVDDFVGAHPQGYDLEIRERGSGLSGGQRQTINLARSLLHDPQVLLLDEPTSSMDQGTEQKVVGSLKSACGAKTMLIVTHRNPILTMVDRVFVLENGQLVADQTPEQLGLKKG